MWPTPKPWAGAAVAKRHVSGYAEHLMIVYFAHGKESGPWGSKIKRLAAEARDLGFDVESIDYSDLDDVDQRVTRLVKVLANEKRGFLLVGSSMGGYVSLVASEQVNARGLFLLAPALHLPGYGKQSFAPRATHIEIVHGWSDDVVPPENSIRFARAADCSLHLISGDHRLKTSIETVVKIFRRFLKRALTDCDL